LSEEVDPHDHDEEGDERGHDDRDPVRAEVEDQLLVVGEQPPRERHRADAISGRPRGPGPQLSQLSRWATSPKPTTSTPAAVATRRPPRSSMPTASPSTTSPEIVWARTRLPTVTERSRWSLTTSAAKPGADGRYAARNDRRNAPRSSAASTPSSPVAPEMPTGGGARFTPTPSTRWSMRPDDKLASARIPASFRPWTRTSFGHLHPASTA